MAELVSKMEYDKAKALGIPGDRIILNGPHKPIDTLAAAVLDGVTINVDRQVEKMVALGYAIEAQQGSRMDYIDIGGGISISAESIRLLFGSNSRGTNFSRHLDAGTLFKNLAVVGDRFTQVTIG
jgi:diaminopimelate decarboxylase